MLTNAEKKTVEDAINTHGRLLRDSQKLAIMRYAGNWVATIRGDTDYLDTLWAETVGACREEDHCPTV